MPESTVLCEAGSPWFSESTTFFHCITVTWIEWLSFHLILSPLVEQFLKIRSFSHFHTRPLVSRLSPSYPFSFPPSGDPSHSIPTLASFKQILSSPYLWMLPLSLQKACWADHPLFCIPIITFVSASTYCYKCIYFSLLNCEVFKAKRVSTFWQLFAGALCRRSPLSCHFSKAIQQVTLN